jgi:hypothetical protein
LNRLYERYRDRADFWIVYVREAHPKDGWQVPQNVAQGVTIAAPKTLEERERAAMECQAHLELKIPILIDGMDDAVEKAYSGWPDRIYVVGRDGRIAYKGGPGPGGFRPAEAERALATLLRG